MALNPQTVAELRSDIQDLFDLAHRLELQIQALEAEGHYKCNIVGELADNKSELARQKTSGQLALITGLVRSNP
jgi:acid stress-induced BolA-like protein IbaG/YrbA